MINFKTVKYKNFLSTGQQFIEIPLDKSSTTLVVGENGAGKSTLLDALCFGLFQRPFRNIKKDQLINTINEKECVVEVQFSVGQKEYKIVQGFNGKFSHSSTYSKYAIDFSLKIGDTITSVDDGYVVGLIEKYKEFGTSKKWKENDRSNYITIYHPHSGLYSQYVHLNYNGGIIELGDYVEKGQPIGISGMTGYTTIEHLHFNVKIPTDKYGLISTEYEFENEIKASELKRDDVIKNHTQQGM